MPAERTRAGDPCEPDPLLAAILDEPPASSDAGYLTEYHAARTDLTELRRRLTSIADTLIGAETGAETGADIGADSGADSDADPVPRSGSGAPGGRRPAGGHGTTAGGRAADGPPGPPGRPGASRRARRGRRAVVGSLFAVLVVCGVFGLGWLLALSGTGAGSAGGAADAESGDAKVTAGGYVACARLIVEGTVTRVEPEPGTGQDRIGLTVERRYKPRTGPGQVTFLMDHDVSPRLRTGDRVLVAIPRHASSPDIWSTGEQGIARDRAWILEGLEESRTLTCDQGDGSSD
ncbi:hypothetical protein ABZ484_12020 [Streptomyces sp. NPDC006393]|uniref:hypothetical protein n=1 Tax=Streptomyces sp. NPDC006393 TaxID=3156763 RepID=UPI0033C05351